MCIIVDKIHGIAKTQIFVSPSLSGSGRQLTVYANAVSTMGRNLMLLPVPYPETIRFEEFAEDYTEFFKDLKYSLFDQAAFERSLTRSSAPAVGTGETLPIMIHGSYSVSIARTIDDLYRLDSAYFDFSPTEDLLHLLEKHYSDKFGYICCKLRVGGGFVDYEPLAYSHTRLTVDSLFVPTLHYHPDGAAARGLPPLWDHRIYSVATDPRVAHRSGEVPRNINAVHWDKIPLEYRATPLEKIRLWECKGYYPNKDLLFPVIA
jgi:hypothetical protein